MGGYMGNFIKKNWFVSLVILVFTCITIYYIYDTNKGKLPGKQADGEDVVYTIGEENITTSEFYDELFDQAGSNAVVTLFQKALANECVEATDEMKEFAAAQKTSIENSYRSQYGADYASYLEADLSSMGYTDIEDYLLTTQKSNKLISDYAKANFDDLKIRQISYILIKHEAEAAAEGEEAAPADTESQSDKDRKKAVDDAFANGDEFATVAQNFSEDASTAESGGVLGIIDANTTTLDEAFLNAALALKEGETSDWVYSEQFGYFRIRCDAATQETLELLNPDTDPYMDLVQNYDSQLGNTALWKKAEEIGFDFKGDAELEKTIRNAFGMNEDKEAE